MDSILLNRNSKLEYRLYFQKPELDDNQILYKGHKLAINESMLEDIIWYKYELSSGKIFYLRYNVWLDKYPNEIPNYLMVDLWKSGTLQSKKKDLYETWETILQYLRKKYGNINNIYISKINI